MDRVVPSSVDVAIVGGGIVGCSTAWQLAQRGVRVALFERARIASEQSSRAWGFIRQQGRHEAELPLAAEANGMWIELTRRHGPTSTEFTAGGILVPAETEADEERVRSGHEVAAQFQLRTQILNRQQIRDLIPEMAGDWRSGLYTPSDAHGDPLASTRTIAEAARQAGAVILEEMPVLSVETSGGRMSGVVTSQGRCSAGAVVLAGGIGTAYLARTLGLNLPIQVILSSVGQTSRAMPFTKLAMWGPKVAFRPRPDGSFTLGNGYRGLGTDYQLTIASLRNLRHFLPAYRRNWRLLKLTVGGDFLPQLRAAFGGAAAVQALPEPTPNHSKVERNFAAFKALFPHLPDLELARAWAGRLDLTPDVIPIIDRPDERALFVAAGFSGHGFALGPSIGKQLSEWILDGRPSLDLKPFRLARFVEGDLAVAKQAL